jgi:branched-chain amino acid transport system substrate-binding protein
MKNRNGLRYLALLGVLTLVIAACGDGGGGSAPEECEADEFGCVEVASGEAIKLGSLLVTTGPNSSLGLDSQYGVELALDAWGTEGEFDGTNGQIKGHDVALTSEDDGCSADGGTAGANKLAADSQIVAVIGTSCSSAALGVADKIFSDKGISIVSPSNTGPALTADGTHQPFYFRTAHNDSIQGAAVANFAYEFLGLRTAATIHDGSPYADGLQQVFADTFTSLGGTVTKQEAIQVGDTDFNPVLTDIATDAPEFLYFPIFVAEGALITQQARETAGLDDTVLGGADGILTPDWIAAAGDAANGTYLSGPDLNFSGDFYADEFLPAYTDVSGEDAPISVFHAHAYDAYNMLAQAIEEVAFTDGGTTYIPRSELRDAFFGISGYAGITGSLTCDENGDCADAKISVSEVVDGAFERIWPEE